MTRAREWQVSLDFKARLDEDAAFDLMEALGRYGASVAVDPGHTGGGLTLAVDAPDGETALDKALTLLEKNMPGATVTGLEAREWADAVARNREPLYPPVVGYAEIARMTGVTRQRAYAFPRIESFPKPVIETSQGPLYSEDAVRAWAQTRELRPASSDPDVRKRWNRKRCESPAAARRGVYFLQGGSGRSPMDSSGRESAVTRSGPVGSRDVWPGP